MAHVACAPVPAGNLIAPSHDANGAGGTCPSAEVGAAVAAFIIAANREKPSPVDIIALIWNASTPDSAALASLAELDGAAMASIQNQISALSHPSGVNPRRLDAAGVLNVWAVYQGMVLPADTGAAPSARTSALPA